MNSGEGLRRIAQVVRWCGNGIAALVFVGGVLAGLSDMSSGGHTIGQVLGVGAFIVVATAFFYYSAKALAWVIDGFAKDK